MTVDFYSFAKGVVKSILTPLYRIEVIGAEKFPKEGGVLLCANHISNLDPPILGITAPRPIHFMAKEELFRVPLLKNLITTLHAFPVKRGMSDRQALRTGLEVLKQGHVLGIFPEGTRSKDGKLKKGLPGVGFFALRTSAAVVPCAIIGSYRPFVPLKVVYGSPIDMTPLREKKASPEEATAYIMQHIQALLDQYR
ncbi:1-acyl-sn-glycerol-3-phosphate acyltransferase [Geobacillus sp. NFOSA3]|uniref:1-acyl-sn-glycerol-3-phosphate acyltransferase n=1 Tax=Parageobacillus galactosidasius TaxID=883812 RepID=A0A226QI11_9BACL|nr:MULTISPECIES: lysophospholipid acyltransferase family protein [Bacillaceae]NNU92376.1 1-acyl-sn-glycerol-3-phosphate acyltransferase [Geobacillus sp. NFOSA3]OQO99413.1 1-acyl-sn-glycerol-3-phosphate acyltransferase [Geobacillus sp. 44C]PDM41091.1 1-acyl-sn-glycerol-3-phosphate acyltransferase [Parageobacillus yumthangensis]TXK91096.1 1-acyl-sn-glycerol-3-phosphate acyltransferase [Parageobacillus sp. SY1]MED4969944.1 lysophospholipid acyltransferase family protein [Parageobacillus toebii]